MLLSKRYQTIIISSIAIASLVLVGFAANSSALTYQNSTDVEFTLNPSINITLSDPNLIIDNLTPGSSSDSNIITATVSTNAGYGYYMSATAGTSSTDTNLTSPTGSIFTNLSSNAATLSSFPDNYWGYSYSTDNGTTWISGSQGNTNSGYNGLPLDNDDSGATGVILNSTDSFTNSGSVKFKIGAKASSSQASGTYTNTVNFYAVANPEPTLGPVDCDPGKICYNVNSLTATEGTMGKQEQDDSSNAIADGSTVTLLASNFSRTGYGFAGWSDTYDYSGNLYGPQETISAPTGTTTNGLSLYAIWIKSEGSLQDSTKVAQVCGRLTAATPSTAKTLNSVSALTDQRDNNTYAIAKLADGKCWMIENLRLENTGTDNTNGSLAQGYNSSFIGLADPETPWANNSTDANSLYTTESDMQGKSTISGSNQVYRFPRYNNTNISSRAEYESGQNVTTQNASIYSYGNYYTWAAAIADTTAYTSNNTSVTNTSICPSGWHLPKGGDKSNEANNEFWSLIVTGINGGTNPANYKSSTTPYYTGTPEGTDASNKLRAYPNNFVYSGDVYGGSVYNRGSSGRFWSSTANSSSYAYNLNLYSSDVSPGTGYYSKYYGRTVRCVAPGV